MTDNTERAHFGRGFWLLWVLASTVGLAVGYFAFFVGIALVTEWVFGVLWFAIAGIVLGIAQGLVLFGWKVSRAGWWVLASSLGFGVSRVVAEAMGETVFSGLVSPAVIGAMIGVIIGASLGIAQWLVVWRQVPRAGWWVLASTVGLGMGFSVAWFPGVYSSASAVNGAVTGAIYGAFSGGVMVWLLRQSVTEEPSLPQDAAEPEGGGMKRWVWTLIGLGVLALIPSLFVLIRFLGGPANQDGPDAQAREHYNRGTEYLTQGNDDLAIEEYTKAIALDPQFALAYHNRGIVYVSKGDLDRAIADYDQAIALDPNRALNYRNRGFAYGIIGDFDQAIADYDQAIALRPEDAGFYVQRGLAYANKGDADRAIADFEKALELGVTSPITKQTIEERTKDLRQTETPIDPSPP